MKMRKKKYSIGVWLLILCMSIMILPVKAEDAEQFKVVRVACGMNDALYLDEFGDPAGLALPFIRQVAWNAGWTPEYVEGSYTENLQRLRDGEIDLMLPIGEEEDPEGKLSFSEFSIGTQQIGLFAKENADIYYEDFEAFNGKKVGLSLGSNSDILDQYAEDHSFSYTKLAYQGGVQAKIQALMNGDVDMIAVSTLNYIPGGKLVAVLEQLPVYLCTNKANTQIYEELNKAIRKAMVNTPDVVAQCYKDMLIGTEVATFTREEHDKIASSQAVVFGVYSDVLPLAGVNTEGKCVGIYVDILKAMAKQSGLHIEIMPVENDSQLYHYMDEGIVDFVISLSDLRFNVENADNYLISNGIAEYSTIAVSKPDYNFEEDDSTCFALPRTRDYLEAYIYSNYPGAVVQYYGTRKECLEAVEEGKADASFVNTWEFVYDSKNPRFEDLIEWETTRLDSTFAIGATKTSDMELLSILEKTISQMPQSTIAEIVAENLNMSYDSYTFYDRLYMARERLLVGAVILFSILIIVTIYIKVKRKYIRELELANKTKSDFLSRMSHELRTPLNAISSYALIEKQALQEGTSNTTVQIQNMDHIQNASTYLLGIIKDILHLRQMETGEIQLEKKETNLKQFVDSIIPVIQPFAKEKKVRFSCYTNCSDEDCLFLDELRLKEGLFNILYNALKFTPDGGNVWMNAECVHISETRAKLIIHIRDNGIGMSKEFMETKLYEKFAQENEDVTSPYSGVGNSLAISKQFVDLMGGELTCASELGVGTTFTITLETEYSKNEKMKEEAQPVLVECLNGTRVLMCEDNRINQDIERRILEHVGCEVEVADDGQIGLEKFKASEVGYYNVVLMDIRMPHMDGLETTRQIRALDREDARTVPIIAVSANAFDADVQASLAAGMDDHLSKPVDVNLLYKKMVENISKIVP